MLEEINPVNIVEVSRHVIFSYDFRAIVAFMVSICLIYVVYIFIIQTPEVLSGINPIFKELFDIASTEYMTNITFLEFLWKIISGQFNCVEQGTRTMNLITRVLTDSLKIGLLSGLQTAQQTCIQANALIPNDATRYLVVALNALGIYIINPSSVSICAQNVFNIAQQQNYNDFNYQIALLQQSVMTRVSLIGTLLTISLPMLSSSLLYLTYRGIQQTITIANNYLESLIEAITEIEYPDDMRGVNKLHKTRNKCDVKNKLKKMRRIN